MARQTSEIDSLGALLLQRQDRQGRSPDAQSDWSREMQELRGRLQHAVQGLHSRVHHTQRWGRRSFVEVEALKAALLEGCIPPLRGLVA